MSLNPPHTTLLVNGVMRFAKMNEYRWSVSHFSGYIVGYLEKVNDDWVFASNNKFNTTLDVCILHASQLTQIINKIQEISNYKLLKPE